MLTPSLAQKGMALVLRDFEGETLRDVLSSRFISLKEFLQLAIELTLSLGRIHKRGVIHKDIKPDNIKYNPKTGLVFAVIYLFIYH